MPECVFCDRKNFESRIIHETDLFFVVATLGQITDGGYVLIIPKYHLSCIAEMHDTKAGPFLVLLDDVREAIKREYGRETLMFEHGIVGQSVQHAHLHLLPGEDMISEITKRVMRDFPSGEKGALNDVLLNYDSLFESYYESPEPYLFWKQGDSAMHICWNPPAPQQYLRKVVAELLGRPERANWRNMDRVLDDKLIAETIARLKPHFT